MDDFFLESESGWLYILCILVCYVIVWGENIFYKIFIMVV